MPTVDTNAADKQIVVALAGGRNRPSNLARRLGYSREYVSQRLTRLAEHRMIERVDDGIYELREGDADAVDLPYREKAIAYYSEQCQVCDDEESVVVHHRDGDRENNEIENLIPVCESCHQKIHGRNGDVAEYVEELGEEPRYGDSTSSIRASQELLDELHGRKQRGDSYEDVIWRLIEEAEPGEVREPPRGGEEPVSDPQPPEPERRDESTRRGTGSANLGEIVDDVDVPDPYTDERREGIRAALELLREEGTASSSELRKEAWEADGGTYADEESWWSNVWKGGASDELQESGVIELENKYAGTWKWAG